MRKIKGHEDGKVPNDVNFVELLWKVDAGVSGGKPNIKIARRKNKPYFALKIYIFLIFKLL
jgi:hypothetical protein